MELSPLLLGAVSIEDHRPRRVPSAAMERWTADTVQASRVPAGIRLGFCGDAEAIEELAEQRRMTMGQVISDLVRKALEPKAPPRMRNGVPLFVPKARVKKPHLALVNRLRDEA